MRPVSTFQSRGRDSGGEGPTLLEWRGPVVVAVQHERGCLDVREQVGDVDVLGEGEHGARGLRRRGLALVSDERRPGRDVGVGGRRCAGWTADGAGQIIAVMGDVAPEQDRMARFLDRAIIKLMYKPVGIIASVAGGTLASMLFARLWRALTGRGNVPEATDKAKSWADILPAAALHGIVFGVVKALVDRASAKEFERLTGRWPGKRSPAQTGTSD